MKTYLKKLEETNQALSNQLDDLEQHTRRTNIRICGMTDNTADSIEDTDVLWIVTSNRGKIVNDGTR